MAKRRSKPVAEAVEASKAVEATPGTTSEPVAESSSPLVSASLAEPTPAPDVFDNALAAREAGQFEQAATPDTNTRVEEALASGGVVRGSELQPPSETEHHRESEAHHADQEPRRSLQPDPMPIETITLGDTNDAPKMRLFRNQRFNQMAIQLDEKPDAKYTGMLRDAGFRWRQDDKVWTKQMPREEKWKTQADAERLFRDIANGIRADRGFEPVQAVGMGAA
jgi:hypothetical protein